MIAGPPLKSIDRYRNKVEAVKTFRSLDDQFMIKSNLQIDDYGHR